MSVDEPARLDLGHRAQAGQRREALVERDPRLRAPRPGRRRAAAAARSRTRARPRTAGGGPARTRRRRWSGSGAPRSPGRAARPGRGGRPRARARSGAGRARSRCAWRSRTVEVTPAGLWSSRYAVRRRATDDATVDRDDRRSRVDLRPERRDLAVDGDPAGGDEHLARPADATPAAARTFWSRSAGISRRSGAGVGTVVAGGPSRRRRVGSVTALAALLGQPRRDVDVERRQLVEARQPEPLEELEAGAVQERPARRLGPAELDDRAGGAAASGSCSRSRRRGSARRRPS